MDDALRTLARGIAFTARTGRPPRSVTNSSCRCSRDARRRARAAVSSSATRCRPLAQLVAQPPEQRRGGVAEVGAVLLDAALRSPSASVASERLDRLRERRRRSGAVSARLVERAPRSASPPRTVVATRASASGASTPPRAASTAASRTSADAPRAAARRPRRAAPTRLGRQRLPPRDLLRLRRGQRAPGRAPRRGASTASAGEPLRDRRELERLERGVHAASVPARPAKDGHDRRVNDRGGRHERSTARRGRARDAAQGRPRGRAARRAQRRRLLRHVQGGRGAGQAPGRGAQRLPTAP